MNGISIFLIILAIVVVVGLWFIVTYNQLIKLRNWVKEAWSQIDVQLTRRNDLIPNLVETVKGYAKHERETLESVIEQRKQVVQLQAGDASPEQVMAASNQLSQTLKSIFALSESYPDLKANSNFIALQEELSNTENKIAYARQLYNSSVAEYNIKRESIPSNIVASLGNFKAEALLQAEEAARTAPKVQF
ncbi:LemA family protein [Atopobacter phocae]|uniref:LemA family protein n=1 Tax=Atopobacter phocae TaxID=136492 RepID=UPI0004B4ABAF|nr:LemA family protein [Atopobacter phocae]